MSAPDPLDGLVHRDTLSSGGRKLRGPLATAAAAIGSFLLESAGEESTSDHDRPAVPRERPVIAVFGLARGCGTSTVARALGVNLALRDPAGVATVVADSTASGLPLATQPATRLARALADQGRAARAVGRLCLAGAGGDLPTLVDLVAGYAPVVIDVGADTLGGVPAALARRSLLVTSPGIEPALAEVAAGCLERVGPTPLVVLNRAPVRRGDAGVGAPDERAPARYGDDTVDRPDATVHPPHTTVDPLGGARERGDHGRVTRADRGPAAFILPESRLGAQLSVAGREPRGEFGRHLAVLAAACLQG